VFLFSRTDRTIFSMPDVETLPVVRNPPEQSGTEDRLEPTIKSPPVGAPRIVASMDHHQPEPELSFRARFEPDGSGAEVSARARSRIGVVAVSCVLIVFFIVAGVVLVVRSGGAQREDLRRLVPGECIERMCECDAS
jgi:hypothetical protein